jgi:hypothetical protein
MIQVRKMFPAAEQQIQNNAHEPGLLANSILRIFVGHGTVQEKYVRDMKW